MRRLVAAVAVAAVALGVAVAEAWPQAQISQGVASANAKAGHPPNVLAAGFSLRPIVQGSDQLENPTSVYDTFGFLADGAPPNLEATKTEPDQNTYLVFKKSPGGPTPGYDYGHHFLFQFHETGSDHAFVTRINLDVSDPTHRITLLTPGDGKTTGFNSGDGSTWDPFAKVMLYSQEASPTTGGVIEQSPFWTLEHPTCREPPSTAAWAAAASRASTPTATATSSSSRTRAARRCRSTPTTRPARSTAKQPNSFVYRFVPDHPGDLTKGKLQVLQVTIDKQVLTFTCTATPTSCPASPAQASGDVFSTAQLKLHSGSSYPGQVGHDPRHLDRRHGAVRRQRRREGHQQRGQQGHPVPAAGERLVPAGHQLPDVLLRRDRRHEREVRHPGAGPAGPLGLDLPRHAVLDRNSGTIDAFAVGDADPQLVRQHDLPLEERAAR